MNSENNEASVNLAIQHLERLNPDQFELFYESRESLKIDSKDQKIESLFRAQDVGLSIRIIRDHRLGFSYTTSLEPAAIKKAVDSAFELATFMPEDQNAGLFSFGTAVYPAVDLYDRRGMDVPLKQKAALAQELEALCRKSDPRITGIRAASISESSSDIQMIDSNGGKIRHLSTSYCASLTCKAESNGDSQIAGDYAISNYLDALPIEATAQQAAKWATELLGATAAPTMKCPAVLRNSVVAELLEFLSSSFSAEEIDKGRSMLAGKQGQMIFSEKIHLSDDGLLPGGAGTAPFDAEGIPSRKTILVDRGFFSAVLCDFYHSKKLGVQPSGCSQRSIKSPPSIGFANLAIQAGKTSFDGLFDGMTKGVLITDLMGIHTANPVTGDFSVGASGLLVENGKITRPIRGFAVAGNVLGLFRKVADVGSDLRFFGNIGAPSIRLDEISVGGQ